MCTHSLDGGENKSRKKICGRADTRQEILTPALLPAETWGYFSYMWSYSLGAALPGKAALLPGHCRVLDCAMLRCT